jgi:hypothetical protein
LLLTIPPIFFFVFSFKLKTTLSRLRVKQVESQGATTLLRQLGGLSKRVFFVFSKKLLVLIRRLLGSANLVQYHRLGWRSQRPAFAVPGLNFF